MKKGALVQALESTLVQCFIALSVLTIAGSLIMLALLAKVIPILLIIAGLLLWLIGFNLLSSSHMKGNIS